MESKPIPLIGQRVMHYVDYDLGTVVDRFCGSDNVWTIYVRWDDDPKPLIDWPTAFCPDELLDPPND